MTDTVVWAVPLIGSIVRLDQIREDDLPELFAAIGRPEVFASGYGGGPAGLRDTLDSFESWARGYYRWQGPDTTFVARLMEGPRAGELVGTSTLAEISGVEESAHIGWTAWAPSVWGTGVNPEAKLMMLDHAFGNGLGRVQLQADVLNERSRAAILRLGATFEGVRRRHFRRADGSWRDTAIYSVLIDEWPVVREALVERLRTASHP